MTRLEDLLDDEFLTPAAQLAFDLAQEDQKLVTDLIAARHACGLTQDALAEILGVSQATVSAFERIGNDPKLSTIRRYARAVDVMVRHHVDRAPEPCGASEFLTHVTESGFNNQRTAAAVARKITSADYAYAWPDEATSPDVHLDRRSFPGLVTA